MSIRFAWLLGLVVLISIGLLVACGTKYSASSDGLVLVASQGSAVIQTFSFSLSNGHIAGISNPPATPNVPSSIVIDPAGAYAYTVVTSSSGNGIAAFKVNSNGTMTAVGSVTTVNSDPNPVALAMDSAGKFLFVAGGGVYSYAIGSGGTLTPVAGTFNFPATSTPPELVAVATTPTTFPAQNAVCSTATAPTSEYLYVADSTNYVVWEFGVDTLSGALTNPAGFSQVQPFSTGPVPSGVAVDSCNRFVYVSNQRNNNISAYTICNGSSTQSTNCVLLPPGGLVQVTGSPFSLGSGNGPGPLLVDPFGNYLYVLDTISSTISPFHISPVSGSLTSQTAVATGQGPKAIAIRSDDNWLFVTNYQAGTLSQYSITPATGALSPLPAVSTDNFPFGVAVK